MSNSAEQIEAKLAAYIDGLLPESDRAEIEAYLAANPSHKAIVEELRGHRILITSLPRDKAPMEVMDHVQTHLERTTLLQDVEEAASSMRINRFPQYAAIAAVMMLAVGLGALIYQILPNNNRPSQVVLAPQTTGQLPPSVMDDSAVAPAELSKELRNEEQKNKIDRKDNIFAGMKDVQEAAVASAPVAKDAAPSITPSKGIATAKPAIVMPELAADSRKIDADNPLDRLAMMKVDESVNFSGQFSNDKQRAQSSIINTSNVTRTLVVNTDDLALTNTLVAGYLLENKMDWDSLSKDEYAQLPNKPDGSDNDEQRVMIVRNVTPEQVASINNSFNSQRSGRQNSRLYPQVANVVISGNTPIVINNTNGNNDASAGSNIGLTSSNATGGAGNMSPQARSNSTTLPGAVTMSQNQFQTIGDNNVLGKTEGAAPATQPTTQPTEQNIAVPQAGDMLIIVRNPQPPTTAPAVTATITPATAPSTQEAK